MKLFLALCLRVNSNIPLELSVRYIAHTIFHIIILIIITKMNIIYGILNVEHVLDKNYIKIFPKNKVVKMKWRSKLVINLM